MFRTDDPIVDFNAWDVEQHEALSKLPKCSDCGEPIQEDYYYEIGDKLLCSDCLDYYRKDTEYYGD